MFVSDLFLGGWIQDYAPNFNIEPKNDDFMMVSKKAFSKILWVPILGEPCWTLGGGFNTKTMIHVKTSTPSSYWCGWWTISVFPIWHWILSIHSSTLFLGGIINLWYISMFTPFKLDMEPKKWKFGIFSSQSWLGPISGRQSLLGGHQALTRECLQLSVSLMVFCWLSVSRKRKPKKNVPWK